jgi:uncharacterized delta-60 repeat protein
MPDGSLDPTWGNNGSLMMDANSAYAIAVQPDQKILIVSATYDTLMRLNSNGTVDTTFGTRGVVNSGDSLNVIQDIYGRVLVCGVYETGRGNNVTRYMSVRRFLTNGALDTGFGSNGMALGIASPTASCSLASDPNANVFLGAHYQSTSTYSDFALHKFTSSGAVDPSFSGGIVTFDHAGLSDWLGGIALQDDGKLIAAGHFGTNPSTGTGEVGLIRVNQDGTLDQGFGTGGKTHFPITNDDVVGNVVIRFDPVCSCPKIVIAGGGRIGSTDQTTFAQVLTF